MGPRDDRIRHTKAAIADAALELFLTKGYDETTVDEVADRACVSRSTVFRYFVDKGDLVFARDAVHLAELQRLLREAAPAPSDPDALHSVFLTFAAYLETDETLLPRVGLTIGHPGLFAQSVVIRHQWEDLVAKELARCDRPTLQHRVAAATVVGAVQSGLREWHTRGGRLVPILRRALRYTNGAAAR